LASARRTTRDYCTQLELGTSSSQCPRSSQCRITIRNGIRSMIVLSF
jgi:hypothetical protein